MYDEDDLKQLVAGLADGEGGVRELLWYLGYTFKNAYLPLPSASLSDLCVAPPQVVGSACGGDFTVVWFPLDRLNLEQEAQLWRICGRTHPYALYLFSDRENKAWHFACPSLFEERSTTTFRVDTSYLPPAVLARIRAVEVHDEADACQAQALAESIRRAFTPSRRAVRSDGLDDTSFRDVYSWWLQQVGPYRPLTGAEERHLGRHAHAGDIKARSVLVNRNLRLSLWVAAKWRGSSVELNDLVQHGNIGLVRAAERFDPSRGARFSTYATYWIRQKVLRAQDNETNAVRLPAYLASEWRRILRIREQLLYSLGREPSLQELSEQLGIAYQKLESLHSATQPMLSLDELPDDITALCVPWDPARRPHDDVWDEVMANDRRETIAELLGQLAGRQADVLRLRFGLGSGVSLSLQTVAEIMHLSRERVRQIESRALKNLKMRLASVVGVSESCVPESSPKSKKLRSRTKQ